VTFGTYGIDSRTLHWFQIKVLMRLERKMFHLLHQALFYLHVTVGGLGLLVFWLPVLSKKGTKFHNQAGKVFVYSMYIIALSGLAMSVLILIDPVGVRFPDRSLSIGEAYELKDQNRRLSIFLLMLSLLTLVNVKHSILVLKAKKNRDLLKAPSHLACFAALILAGITVGLVAFYESNLLYGLFSLLSITLSFSAFRYIYKPEIKPREWIMEHMANILGAGIAAYTAFFAFGGRRFFSEILLGNMQFIPWLLPSVVGATAIYFLSKKYRQVYKIA